MNEDEDPFVQFTIHLPVSREELGQAADAVDDLIGAEDADTAHDTAARARAHLARLQAEVVPLLLRTIVVAFKAEYPAIRATGEAIERASAARRCSVIATEEETKRWQTAVAQTVLAGFSATLLAGDDGRPLLVVSRWALCRSFAVIEEAEAWVSRLRPAATSRT